MVSFAFFVFSFNFFIFFLIKIYILIHIRLCAWVGDKKIFTRPISGNKTTFFSWLKEKLFYSKPHIININSYLYTFREYDNIYVDKIIHHIVRSTKIEKKSLSKNEGKITYCNKKKKKRKKDFSMNRIVFLTYFSVDL